MRSSGRSPTAEETLRSKPDRGETLAGSLFLSLYPVFWTPAATPLTVSCSSRSMLARSGAETGSARNRSSSRTWSSDSEST